MNNVAAVTIISKNYLPFAKILHQSIPLEDKIDFYVFVIDEDHSYDYEGMKIITRNEVVISNFYQKAMYYDITEFNTCVKPDVLSALIEKGYSSVIYLDPDIRVYSSLSPIYAKLENYDFVLTPHITSPINDEFFPTEIDMLKTGCYNLGFIGVSSRGLPQLKWWSNRLNEYCFNDTQNGLFTDQKWMDLLISMNRNVFVEYPPAYNIAYWNLHERSIEHSDSKYLINGEELVFFHFSGINTQNPSTISRYQNRSNFSNRPDLIKIFTDYASDVNAVVSEFDRGYEYIYNTMFNTYAVNDEIRRLYKRFIEVNPDLIYQNPFVGKSGKSFIAWLIKNKLVGEKITKHDWEEDKILHKAEDLLRSRYKKPFLIISRIMITVRQLLGYKKYTDLMRVLNLLSNSRRGKIIYDEKIKL